MKTLKLLPIISLFIISEFNLFAQPVAYNSVNNGLWGVGQSQGVFTSIVFNGELYVGGSFTLVVGSTTTYNIAKWNGTAWSAVGIGLSQYGQVNALVVYNSELYVGGTFGTAGGITTTGIAKWNGTTWSALGAGVWTGSNGGYVNSLAVYSSTLYVGGEFTTAGSASARNIAKWNGSAWTGLGSGVNSYIWTMCVFNSDLYLGGQFDSAGSIVSPNIAKWNGSSWSTVGSGINNSVFALQVYNSNLFAGGNSVFAKWNGTAWSSVGTTGIGGISGNVKSMTILNNVLYVGGSGVGVTISPFNVSGINKWNGTNWIIPTSSINFPVSTINVYNNEVYVGGYYPSWPTPNIARISIIANEPTTSSSNIQFSNRTQSSVTLNWTNGNGQKHLVVAKAGSSVDQLPYDGQTYTASSVFGNGSNIVSTLASANGNYVVYNGTGNTFSLTGLSPDVAYNFAIGEHNDSTGNGFENYLTASNPTARYTTIANEPTTNAANLSFGFITPTTMKVFFTAGSGTKRIIIAKKGSVVTSTPVDTFGYTADSVFGNASTSMGNGNYVVYNGTGTSFTLSGLDTSSNYYFAAYEYNGSTPAANNYLLTNFATGIKSTVKKAPTTPTTNLMFTSISPTSISVSWSNGNGSKRLLAVRAYNWNHTLPSNGQTYTANAAFGSGSNIGNNNYAVYSGTGNSAVVTNLSAETVYYFSVYELSDSSVNGFENYLTTNYPIINRTTLAIEPTANVSSINFTNIAPNSMTVSLTAGNGNKRIVVSRQGIIVNKTPSDTIAYTANSAFGNIASDLGSGNYVVYNGNGNSFNLTNLSPGSIYYFAVYEYNGSSTPALNYLTTGVAIANHLTIKPEPTTASNNLQFTNVGKINLTLLWTNGNGNKHVVVAKALSAVSQLPIDTQTYTANASFSTGTNLGNGNYVVYSGTGNTVNVTNLNAETVYHFAIFELNDSTISGYENYLISTYSIINRTTLATEPTTIASNFSFNQKTINSFKVSFVAGNGSKRIVLAKQGSAVNNFPKDTVDYFANSNFSSATDIGNGNYVVYNGTGNNFDLSGLTSNTTYYFAVYEYNGTSVKAYNYLTSSSGNAFEATIKAEPSTTSSNLQFTNVGTNGLTLSWLSGNGNKHLVVAKASSSVNQVPIDTQTYTANASFGTGTNLGNGNYVIYNGTGNSVNLTNLNPDAYYYFAIYELNDSTVAGYENYLTSSYLTSNRTTLAVEPTTNASNISFSQRSINGFKVSFAQGNGTKRIVVAKQGSTVDKLPNDTIDYLANASFGATGTDLGSGNFVVYNGSSNSFTLTNLLGNTNYYFAIYEYNGSSPKANNYLINSIATGMGATIKLEPTLASNSIQFTNVSVNGLNLTWTNGNGSKHLVVAKAANSVNANPIDTQTYLASTSFGSGTNLGNGNFVVYNGIGNFVNVTNLNAETIYYFKIFEFNDSTVSGYENYLTSNNSASSHITLAVEPTTQTAKLSFSSANFTTMNVNITAGNGSKRIVIAKQGSAISNTPLDTFEYTANPIFGTTGTDLGGGNFVVYNGSGNSFNLSGLTANTLYYFASYEYNGSTPIANNYLLTNPAIGYQSTLTTEPTKQDTLIQFTNIKDSSMTLSWTVGNGQRRLVVAATSAVTTAPIDGVDHLANDTFSKGADFGFGNYVVYSGTSNTFNIKGLTPNTNYHFAVYEYNGTNTSNNYLLANPAIGSKSTLIAEPNIAASNLTLSPITNGITTVNWTNGNGDNRIVIARQGAPINILPEDGKSYTANAVFASGQDLGQGNFVCYIGNNNTFNLQGLDPSNLYYIGVIEYNGSGGGSNYKLNLFPIADNLPAEPTTLATNMNFTNITTNSVKVNWTNGNGSYRILVAKEATAVTKKPSDGTVYVGNNAFGSGADLGLANFVVYNGVANSATVTNLNNNSKYHFALFEFNKDASGPANYANNSLVGSVDIGSPQGVEDISLNGKVRVYPNPSTGVFTFENKSNENSQVQVFDINGRLVDGFIVEATSNKILDYSLMKSGLYLLNVKSGNTNKNIKLLIIE